MARDDIEVTVRVMPVGLTLATLLMGPLVELLEVVLPRHVLFRVLLSLIITAMWVAIVVTVVRRMSVQIERHAGTNEVPKSDV